MAAPTVKDGWPLGVLTRRSAHPLIRCLIVYGTPREIQGRFNFEVPMIGAYVLLHGMRSNTLWRYFSIFDGDRYHMIAHTDSDGSVKTHQFWAEIVNSLHAGDFKTLSNAMRFAFR